MWWTADKLVCELAGGVARSVASRLGDVVSIRDFGADGTGVADCSATAICFYTRIDASSSRLSVSGF